jgi:hypothetical protein
VTRWLAISLAMHVVVVVTTGWRRHSTVPASVPAVRPPPAAVTPIAVELLDEPAPPSFAPPARAHTGTSTHRAAAIVVSTKATEPTAAIATTEPIEPGEPAEAPAPHADLQLSPMSRLAEAAAAPPAPASPPAPVPDKAYSDNSNLAFGLDVDRDGTAHLRDKANVQLAIHLPSRHELAAMLERDHTEDFSPPLDRAVDASNAELARMPDIGATILRFDISDAFSRHHGNDPYASAKLRALDATRETRARMSARVRAETLARTPDFVHANIARALALAPADRRRALFELWNECDDSPSGELARAEILATAHAESYTGDELAELNAARASSTLFAP